MEREKLIQLRWLLLEYIKEYQYEGKDKHLEERIKDIENEIEELEQGRAI